MKFIYLLPLLLVPFNTYAAQTTLSCHTTAPVADAGYFASFSPDMSEVLVGEQSIAGPHTVAHMICDEQNFSSPNVADATHTMYCRQKGAIDGGLVLMVTSGGIAGIISAKLQSFAIFRGKELRNTVQFGDLACQYNFRQ